MADTRELIMARLVELMEGLSGVNEVVRDQLLTDDTKANTISVFEGDELIDEQDQANTRNRPANTPVVMHMQPQIHLQKFASAATVGAGLSTMRAAVIKAIAADATLAGYTVKGRGGIYMGFESDLAFAREMLGQMALKFQFTYSLNPSDL